MMWKFLFENISDKIFPAIFVLCICFAFCFLQIRLEQTQKNVAEKEEQCKILQNTNKKQQENITRLVQEQKKQEELFLQAEREKQRLMQSYQKKQAQFYQNNDEESTNWKQTKIPASVLQILKKD